MLSCRERKSDKRTRLLKGDVNRAGVGISTLLDIEERSMFPGGQVLRFAITLTFDSKDVHSNCSLSTVLSE